MIELYNDDCFNVFPKIENETIDLIATDIPYNEVNRKSNGLRNLDKGEADILNFPLKDFLMQCARICKGSIYIFCGTEQVSEIRHYFAQNKWSTRHCIWEKSNPSPMNGQHIWLSSIENCIFAKKPKATFNQNCKSCVWKYPTARSKIHSTQKPLKLFEYIVESSSNENNLVFDPCMGSGTTGVAAKNLNRNFIGIEQNADWFLNAKRRIENDNK